MVTAKDQQLIALLRLNAREPVASLARKLGISRSTVQDRLRRLEEKGIIEGYSVKLSDAVSSGGIEAFVTIESEARRAADVARAVARLPQVEALHSVSGKYDFIAEVRTRDAAALDKVLDEIGEIAGVTGTESAVILSTKLDRR